jgi:hypothetical protein
METKPLHRTEEQLRVFLHTINRPEIGITVKEGIVTLTGTVDSHAKKISARKAVASVLGVRGIINNIKVSNSVIYGDKDSEIAEAILSAINLSTSFRAENKSNQEREVPYWEIFA